MIKVVHLLPGRLRLRIDAVKGRPDSAKKLHAQLTAVSGIHSARVNPVTGSVLLLYDPGALRSPDFVDALSAALERLFPAFFAPGRLRFTSKRLKGKPELAQRTEAGLLSLPGIDLVEIDPATGDFLLVYDSKVVTSPQFLDTALDLLGTLFPNLNTRRIKSRLGLRRS